MMPISLAVPVIKPCKVSNNSGSLRRKVSWPLSVSISMKLTFDADALKACTIYLDSAVGKSQSLEKEITQNFMFELVKALDKLPSYSAARS